MRTHIAARRMTSPFPFGQPPGVAALGDFRLRIREWAEACERQVANLSSWEDNRPRHPETPVLLSLPWTPTGVWDTPDAVAEIRPVNTEGDDKNNDLSLGTVSSLLLFILLFFSFFTPFCPFRFVFR